MEKINVLYILVLISISFTCCQSKTAIEEKIIAILDEFRHRMCYALEKFGIPALDPFTFKGLDGIQISDLKIGIKDLSAKGLSDFEVKEITIKTLTFKFFINVVIPKFVLKTKYSVNGKVGILDLNGKGDLELEIFNPGVVFEGKLKYSSAQKKTSFEVSQLTPSIEKIKCDITGLFPNVETNKFISQMITDIGLDILGDYYPQYAPLIKSVVENMITEKIKDITPGDLIKLIQSNAPIFNENDPQPDCKNKTLFNHIIPKVNLLIQ